MYLLGLSVYIHKNPAVLGREEGGSYEFSSYPLYAGVDTGAAIDIKEERTEVELLLSQITDSLTYAEYMETVPESEMDILDKELAKKNILGSEGFMQKVRSAAGEEKHSVTQSPGVPPSRFALASRIVIVVLFATAVALAAVHLGLQQRLKTLSRAKEIEYSAKLAKDREFIKKDMQELYRADLVSYQAMQKRLEIEKNKVKELEAKVKDTQKENP
jgi:hypothetical protein